MEKQDLVLVFTGDGKGKTTAALGLLMRAAGWGQRVLMLQFLKSPDFLNGEQEFCKKYGIPLFAAGIGYSWTKSPEEQVAAVAAAWARAEAEIASGGYDLIVLDEINNVLSEKKLPFSSVVTPERVITALKNRPAGLSVVLTGRNAPEELIRFADLVTEMKAVKHPYEQGIAAQKGIEY